MKQAKVLPVLAIALCLPGVVVRALHMLNGFDIGTGLPAVGDAWVWYFTALLVAAAVVYAVLSIPLRAANDLPFEQLLGTQSVGFRMAAVISGLLLLVGGVGYLYLTMTTGEEDAAGWEMCIRDRPKTDPIETLRAQLKTAVENEEYEQAARLRDEIRRMEGEQK